MSLIRTSGSYIANVAMIGGIHIDSDTKKFEHLIGGGDDADSSNQLLSGFSGSATASVIAALNHVYEEATTGQVSTSANNTFSGDNTFSGKLSASNGLAVTSGGAVKLAAGEEDVTLGNTSEQTSINGSNIVIQGTSGIGLQGAVTLQNALTASSGVNFAGVSDGTLDGANVTVGSGKTLNVSDGTLTTSAAQKKAIVEGVGADTDIGNFKLTTKALEASDLTSGRVIIAGANGLLADDSDLTFSGDTLTATKIGAFTAAGAIDFDNQDMTNVDIDSGAIDGTNIGANSAGTGAFTTLEASGVATFSGEITASVGMNIPDDQKLYFGTNFDASIEYDEDGTDELRFAGNAVRFEQLVTFGGEITASMGMLIKDDQKIYFGDGQDASIEYDEDGDDKLKFAGAAVSFGAAITSSAGIDVAADKDIIFRGGGGPVLFDSEDSQFYRVEVQGGLLVLVSLGEGAAL